MPADLTSLLHAGELVLTTGLAFLKALFGLFIEFFQVLIQLLQGAFSSFS